MAFAVVLSDDAATTLEAQPFELARCIDEHLRILANNPIALGRKSGFPYRPAGQVYEFWADAPYDRTYITVFCHFIPGQQSLRVYAIGKRDYARPD